MFHRNLHIPKLKYHFQGHHVKGGNLSLETALLLNYISQPRAFPEILAIYCSDAVRRMGEKKEAKYQAFPPNPRPCQEFKDSKTKHFKGSKGSKTIIQAGKDEEWNKTTALSLTDLKAKLREGSQAFYWPLLLINRREAWALNNYPGSWLVSVSSLRISNLTIIWLNIIYMQNYSLTSHKMYYSTNHFLPCITII